MPTHAAITRAERAELAPRAGRRRSFGSIDKLAGDMPARVAEQMCKAGVIYEDIIDFVLTEESPEALREEVRTRLGQLRTEAKSVKAKERDRFLRAGRLRVQDWVVQESPGSPKPTILTDSALARKNAQIAIVICQQQQQMQMFKAAAEMAPEGGSEAVAEQIDTATCLHALHVITTMSPAQIRKHVKVLDAAAKASANIEKRALRRANEPTTLKRVMKILRNRFDAQAEAHPDLYAATMRLVAIVEAMEN